jgi:hypothetical protein
LHWNIRPGHPAAESARFRMRTDAGQDAEIRYDSHGVSLSFAGKPLGRIESGAVRLVTDNTGEPQALLGISEQPQKVRIQLSGRVPQEISVQPNQRRAL